MRRKEGQGVGMERDSRTSAASAALLRASPGSTDESPPAGSWPPLPPPSVRGGPPTFLGTDEVVLGAGEEPRTRPGGEGFGSALPQMLPMLDEGR